MSRNRKLQMYASNLETHAAGYDARFASNVRAYTSDLEEKLANFRAKLHWSGPLLSSLHESNGAPSSSHTSCLQAAAVCARQRRAAKHAHPSELTGISIRITMNSEELTRIL